MSFLHTPDPTVGGTVSSTINFHQIAPFLKSQEC